MKKLLIIAVILILSLSTYSRDLIGTGIGKSKDEARRYALDDLSQQVEVTVESLFHSQTTTYGDNAEIKAQSVINLRAQNVLLGVEYKVEEIGNEYNARASITSDSMGMYERSVLDLEDTVSVNFKKGKEAQRISDKKLYFIEAYKKSSQADTYRSIARILGSKRDLPSTYTLAEISAELKEIEGQALDRAVVYFDVRDEFESDDYRSHLDSLLDKTLADLSKVYSGQLIPGDASFNNIVIETVVNSAHVDYIEPVYYNGKLLTKAMYKASVTISFLVRDTFEDTVKGSFVTSSTGRSFTNEGDAVKRAISLVIRDSKASLENYIGAYNY